MGKSGHMENPGQTNQQLARELEIYRDLYEQAPDMYASIDGKTGKVLRCNQLVLDKLGYAHDKIILSLENRMKCGIGMCGRCNIGKEFVCKDGPVFTLEELNRTPKEY